LAKPSSTWKRSLASSSSTGRSEPFNLRQREPSSLLKRSKSCVMPLKQLRWRAAPRVGEVGSLGIGFFGTASSPFLPSLVQSYRQKFPHVQLRLHEMTPDQQLAAFDDGQIDLGFSRKLPPDRRAEFEEENVYTDQLGVA